MDFFLGVQLHFTIDRKNISFMCHKTPSSRHISVEANFERGDSSGPVCCAKFVVPPKSKEIKRKEDKTTKRKLMSVVLAMAMVVTMVGTAFAKEENVDIAMQNEIDARMDIIMEDVYRQLEAQDGLVYLDVYEEFFLANVTHEVMMEYGIQTMDTDGKVNYSLRNGGAIYYKSPVPDAEASELVVTCLDRQRTLDYILDKESFSVGTIIESIVGDLGEIGSAAGFVLTLRSFADAAAKSSIKKAGGYTKIVNTYNPTYKEGALIVTGWSDHPFVVTPSDSYDHHVERFPEYVEP